MTASEEKDTSDYSDADKPIAFVIGPSGFIGTFLRFLRRFQLPVVALGRRHMYRVLLEGSGFELPLDTDDPNPNGFFATRFVAASTRTEAEAFARASVIRDWQGLSLFSHFTGVDEPILTVSESESIEGWFKLHKGGGFAFFTESDTAKEDPR